MDKIKQKTLIKPVTVKGIGLHSGKESSVTLRPLEPNSGIIFKVGEKEIKVSADKVIATDLSTKIGQGTASLDLVEHLMAALWGLSLDNLLIELEGSEVPILDGSAKAWMEAISKGGIIETAIKRKHLIILKSLEITEGDKRIIFHPYPSLKLDLTIDFPHPVIGKQQYVFDADKGDFFKEIAPARTFGSIKDLEALQARGLALGASLDNALGLTDDSTANPLIWPDEFVRHKILDCLGDFFLSGFYIKGSITAYKTGHRMNNLALRQLLSDPSNYTLV
jgi:UDP-3-O-[3-hydroxymyristoyl] N-acetylglucosamine deacetylase